MKLGPHNTFAHQIIDIEKASETKLFKLRREVNSNLLVERQKLIKNIEIANYVQNKLLVSVYSDIKGEISKDFWSKIQTTENFTNEQVIERGIFTKIMNFGFLIWMNKVNKTVCVSS